MKLYIYILAVVIVGIVGVGTAPMFLGSNKDIAETDEVSSGVRPVMESNSIEIQMTADGFLPDNVEVPIGATVIFKNSDSRDRWPASNIHPTHGIYPEFDPRGPIKAVEEWKFIFQKSGKWRYHDHIYPNQTGIITVIGGGVAAETPVKEEKTSLEGIKDLAIINMLDAALNEEQLRAILTVHQPFEVMQDLIADSGGGSVRDCHQEAHNIGRLAFIIHGPKVFGQGDSSCHSGFYHGAMESFLAKNGTENLAKNIDGVCEQFSTAFTNFECLHGVGHGLLAYLDYNLPEGIKTCGRLSSHFGRDSCYGGLFMENIVIAQGRGVKTGHETQWLKRDDPHFPCNFFKDNNSALLQCYLMQTSWMLYTTGYNFEKVAAECLNAPPSMISICYKSFGRDAAGHHLRDVNKILPTCAKVPMIADYYNQCITGALNVIVEFWGDGLKDQATELCQKAPEVAKENCYRLLRGRLPEVFSDKGRQSQICSGFEEKYRYLCEGI